MKNVVTRLTDCAEFGYKFAVDEQFWAKVNEIILVLKPAYNLTIDMQKTGYGLSDFYIGWLRVKKNLKRLIANGLEFNLAKELIENMERRAPSLFKSPLLLSAIYLDPRMMRTLSAEQKASAAMDLMKIHERVAESHRASTDTNRFNDTLDEIREEFEEFTNETRNHSDLLLKEISTYESENAYDIRAPVMRFWQENSHAYRLLRPLADILHAVPSNQCCTERSFSSFSYIRSKHRMSMLPQNTSNVLMIRLNKDVYYTLREERVQKILK